MVQALALVTTAEIMTDVDVSGLSFFFFSVAMAATITAAVSSNRSSITKNGGLLHRSFTF